MNLKKDHKYMSINHRDYVIMKGELYWNDEYGRFMSNKLNAYYYSIVQAKLVQASVGGRIVKIY